MTNYLKTLLLALLLLQVQPAEAQWETWKGCRLIPNESNDGDSFHVGYKGEEHTLRLYFVDTPETDESNRGGGKRVQEQAEEFGVPKEVVMHIGRFAKQATAQMLSKPFTVLTRRADGGGNTAGGRILAFITTSDGKDLAEELVRNGLARSHGYTADPPGKNSQELRSIYDRLESRARKIQVGIFSPHSLRSIALAKAGEPDESGIRPAVKEEKSPLEPKESQILGPDITIREPAIPEITWTFEESAAVGGSTRREKSPAEASAPQGNRRVNINSATTEQLQTIPGIGPALASRIIEGRPYATLLDVENIKGIGPEKFSEIQKVGSVE